MQHLTKLNLTHIPCFQSTAEPHSETLPHGTSHYLAIHLCVRGTITELYISELCWEKTHSKINCQNEHSAVNRVKIKKKHEQLLWWTYFTTILLFDHRFTLWWEKTNLLASLNPHPPSCQKSNDAVLSLLGSIFDTFLLCF